MLENRRRSQLRLEPLAAIPTTRTTTRRTRRLCLNIETNGAGPLRTRRRRRSALPDPYLMAYPPVRGVTPFVCGDWGSNEHLYNYGNLYNPFNRLYAGEEYGYAPVNGFIPPDEEPDQTLYANNSGQKAAGDLENILLSLDGYLQEENNAEPEYNAEMDSMGVPEDRSSQNNEITEIMDVICDTIGSLNNYVTAINPGHMDNHNLRPFPRAPPPVQVLQLPVQPLILPPILPNSVMYPPNNPYVMEPESRKTNNKSFFERLPWLRERKRKRHAKAVTRVQSQCCSTEDLHLLPRILEASNSPDMRVPMNVFSPPMKDCSTTMWCSMKCGESCGLVRTREQKKSSEDVVIPPPMTKIPIKCGLERNKEQKNSEISSSMTLRCPMKSSSLVTIQEREKSLKDYKIPSPTQEQENPFEVLKIPSPIQEPEKPIDDVEISSPIKSCGLVRIQEQKKPSEDFKYPSPMSIGAHFPPSLLRAPPPSMKSEDDVDSDHEMDLYNLRKQSSSSSSCDCHRNTGGNLVYSFVEEEQLQLGEEKDHVDEDEWYQGASYKLAELEMEQEFFREMQRQSQVFTRDQKQQTDGSESVNIIATTDKAISTTDISGLPNREPVKIIRIYKGSSLKPRHRLTSSSQRLRTKGGHRVKFEKEQQAPTAPEIVTIGRCPMDWEETARSINRFCTKRSSSSNSKGKRT